MDFLELGRYLRETREARELTLEDAETALKIRRHILNAFETGEFGNIRELSPVQVRGFIRNYARYLGLDADLIIDYYDVAVVEANDPTIRRQREEEARKAAARAERKERRERKKRRTQPIPAPVAARSVTDTDPSMPVVPEDFITMGDAADLRRRRRRNGLNRSVLVLVAIAAIAIILFVVYELLQRPAGVLEFEDVPDIIVTDTPTATFTALPTSTSAQVALLPTERVHLTQVYNGQGVMVSILTQQRTWIRVEADGQERFAGVAPPGSEINVGVNEFINEVLLTATNAEALLVTYNGEPQRTFGGRGQRVDVTFRVDGLEVSSNANFEPTSPFTATPPPTVQVDVGALIEAQTPTNTPGPSPTPTLTLPPSETPTLTPTLTWTPIPTNTPTLTPTIGPSATPTLTETPTLSPTPSLTPTASDTPVPTAILPLRQTATPSPTKPPT
jgi:transcriptional regulator with XRE-family HTH domain